MRVFALVLVGFVMACGDSSGEAGSGAGGATAGGGSGGTADGAGGVGQGAGGASTNGGAPGSGGAGGQGGQNVCPDDEPPVSPGIAECAEIGATTCFSSYECAETERCQDQGTEGNPVSCCIEGERGPGQIGDRCQYDVHCASSLCVEFDGCGRCSDGCVDDGDCPAELPDCIVIAFSGTDQKFCTP